MDDDTQPLPSDGQLTFSYANIHFEGNDLTNEWQILLDIMADFTIKVDSHLLYQEQGFSVVEFAIALNDWLLGDFQDQRDFVSELTEYDEVGMVQLLAVGNHQWRVGSIRQQYEATTPFTADVIEAACHTYIEAVVTDLKNQFGIEGFPMTCRYVGRAVYIHNPCTRCGSGVGFWICGDGTTMVLRCEQCEKVWLEPNRVASPNVKQTHEVKDVIPIIIPTFRRGVSRWATPKEIEAKGWSEWIETQPRFRTVIQKATLKTTTVRINIANIEPPPQSGNLEH